MSGRAGLTIACFSIAFLTGCNAGTSQSQSGTVNDPTIATTSLSVALDGEEAAFVTLINAYRVQNGLAAFKVSVALTRSSQWMSADMAAGNYLDHTDSLGRDPFVRMAAFGYDVETAGENIAAGNASAQDTFTQWKNSPAHNANMLDSGYTVMGVGRADNPSSEYGWYWATDFGSVVDATL